MLVLCSMVIPRCRVQRASDTIYRLQSSERRPARGPRRSGVCRCSIRLSRISRRIRADRMAFKDGRSIITTALRCSISNSSRVRRTMVTEECRTGSKRRQAISMPSHPSTRSKVVPNQRRTNRRIRPPIPGSLIRALTLPRPDHLLQLILTHLIRR